MVTRSKNIGIPLYTSVNTSEMTDDCERCVKTISKRETVILKAKENFSSVIHLKKEKLYKGYIEDQAGIKVIRLIDDKDVVVYFTIEKTLEMFDIMSEPKDLKMGQTIHFVFLARGDSEEYSSESDSMQAFCKRMLKEGVLYEGTVVQMFGVVCLRVCMGYKEYLTINKDVIGDKVLFL